MSIECRYIQCPRSSFESRFIGAERNVYIRLRGLICSNYAIMTKISTYAHPSINETLQTGAGGNRTYREAKVFIYF